MTPAPRRPALLDLCCGLGGWTEGFKAAGYYCIGVDIEDFSETYPGDEFIQLDVKALDGLKYRGIDTIVASPPCDEFARFRMPWLRRKGNLPPPDMSIVEACYQLRDVIQPRVFILENVRSAQYFLGQADVCREPFYFWGCAMMPYRPPMRQKQSWSSKQKAERARIPYELAFGFASMCRASYPALTPTPGSGRAT